MFAHPAVTQVSSSYTPNSPILSWTQEFGPTAFSVSSERHGQSDSCKPKKFSIAILLKCALDQFPDWNKDWKPGPYPRTPKERAAAAKKYNMRVEDYEPYPDDGFGYGDYPKLPRIADEAKDPYQPYDLPNNRRFFGEPVS